MNSPGEYAGVFSLLSFWLTFDWQGILILIFEMHPGPSSQNCTWRDLYQIRGKLPKSVQILGGVTFTGKNLLNETSWMKSNEWSYRVMHFIDFRIFIDIRFVHRVKRWGHAAIFGKKTISTGFKRKKVFLKRSFFFRNFFFSQIFFRKIFFLNFFFSNLAQFWNGKKLKKKKFPLKTGRNRFFFQKLPRVLTS